MDERTAERAFVRAVAARVRAEAAYQDAREVRGVVERLYGLRPAHDRLVAARGAELRAAQAVADAVGVRS